MSATFSVAAGFFTRDPQTSYEMSEDVRTAERVTQQGEPVETSITGQRAVDLFVRLLEACNQSSVDGDTEPVLSRTFERAEAFIKAVPPRVPLPDVMVHPDGEIAFEWQIARDRILTVSVGTEPMATFAAIVDGGTVYGRESFANFLPDEIAHLLDRFFPPPPL